MKTHEIFLEFRGKVDESLAELESKLEKMKIVTLEFDQQGKKCIKETEQNLRKLWVQMRHRILAANSEVYSFSLLFFSFSLKKYECLLIFVL